MLLKPKLTHFYIYRKAGIIPVSNFAKQHTCMSGRLPFISSQMNQFGDCYFSTKMTRFDTLVFLSKYDINIKYCKFINKEPTVLDIYYDRVGI